jgi:hypothetical protein
MILLNGVLFTTFGNQELITAPHDVDKTPDGHTFICTTTFKEMLFHPERVEYQKPVSPNNTVHKVVEIDENNDKVWEIDGLAYPHEVEILPNGHLLIADTGFNRVVEVNYPNKEIIWNWQPEEINWTKVNPEWGPNHYYNKKLDYDWTHLNDVDFIQHETYNACLISLRNFDLIVEVNYTAEKLGPANNPENIVWWFGDHGNHSMIHKQHNPDYLSNGNIIIADSLNNRIIEVNRTTKEIVWEFAEGLYWPRDADELPNGKLLITDSFSCRVFILDRETGIITWQFDKHIIIPYESDLLANGNVLISGEYSGLIYEVNGNGRIIWRHGASIERAFVYLNSPFAAAISIFGLSMTAHKVRTINMDNKGKAINALIIAVFVLLIFINIFLIIAYSNVISAVTRWIYPRIGGNMF